MSDIIQLLPDSVANQIAAGEVIQRPASVIKELVENAVDAGATRIDVLVVDAGRTSIQVIDDGRGMSETDARLAFERHATSKIRQADDLFTLHTMGFRGEALPSIAAVAQVELRTRQASEDIGTHLSIAASRVVGQEACACPVGSNFMVENLFYNVPARRKFLKSNTTELNNILAAFERIALVYPNITFTFHSNGTELFNLHAGGLRQRIVDVFGKRINQQLLPVKVETTVCAINGFVGKPEAAKKKGALQYFFVNGRFMRHPFFGKAIQQAFDRLVPQGEQVPFFIYFDVDPHDIDVNIHPTKTEIKFENEQAIFQILSAAVRDAVGMFNDVSAIDFDTEGKPDIPVFDPTASASAIPAPAVPGNPQYNPFKQSSAKSSSPASPSPSPLLTPEAPITHTTLFPDMPSQQPSQSSIFPSSLSTSPLSPVPLSSAGTNPPSPHRGGVPEGRGEAAAEAGPSFQLQARYLVCPSPSGLLLIDQHRAHIRILFERYQQQLAARKMHSQKVLFPQSLQFTAQEMVTLDAVRAELTLMGFELSSLGGTTYAVNAIPEGLEGIDILSLLRDMLAGAGEKGGSSLQEINDALALSMARAAAIPYGQILSPEEMAHLITALFQCSNVNYTPDGRTILSVITQKEIDARF